jgi:hypothetical protein
VNISTVPGYALALVVDQLYGLPKGVTVGVWRLGDYDPSGQLPEENKLFLGTGEAYNNWKHRFDPNDAGSIPVVIRIRHGGLYPFECIGQLEEIVEEEYGETVTKQYITLADDHKLMPWDAIKEREELLKKVAEAYNRTLME